MITIRSTTFIDYVSAQGTAKLTCVRQAKEQYADEFDVRKDFYKGFREAAVALHEKRLERATLRDVLANLTDPKKRRAYTELIKGYTKWLGRKDVRWLGRTRYRWEEGELTVIVNPELYVSVNGAPTVIKLYCKDREIRKTGVEVMLHLLADTRAAKNGAEVAILDVRRARLIPQNRRIRDIDALARAEAQSFLSIWRSLEPRSGVA